ncbi:MAG TPA: hypothetical protein VIG24_07530 [Acidimicrobiia bacterium]
MTDIVPVNQIERIVGTKRHPTRHIARAVSSEQRVYILHSGDCWEQCGDLRDCAYSVSLDEAGIDLGIWVEDVPVFVRLDDFDVLVPDGEAS